MQHMVENLFGTPGTLFSSKPAIFHPCGSLPLFLLSFPQLSSPEEDYFRTSCSGLIELGPCHNLAW